MALINPDMFEGIVACEDKICVEVFLEKTSEKKTESGIIIPDTKKNSDRMRVGLVKSVGPLYRYKYKKDHVDGMVKPGDYILYNEMTGAPVKIGEKDFLLLEYNQVFGIFVEKQDSRRKTNE